MENEKEKDVREYLTSQIERIKRLLRLGGRSLLPPRPGSSGFTHHVFSPSFGGIGSTDDRVEEELENLRVKLESFFGASHNEQFPRSETYDRQPLELAPLHRDHENETVGSFDQHYTPGSAGLGNESEQQASNNKSSQADVAQINSGLLQQEALHSPRIDRNEAFQVPAHALLRDAEQARDAAMQNLNDTNAQISSLHKELTTLRQQSHTITSSQHMFVALPTQLATAKRDRDMSREKLSQDQMQSLRTDIYELRLEMLQAAEGECLLAQDRLEASERDLVSERQKHKKLSTNSESMSASFKELQAAYGDLSEENKEQVYSLKEKLTNACQEKEGLSQELHETKDKLNLLRSEHTRLQEMHEQESSIVLSQLKAVRVDLVHAKGTNEDHVTKAAQAADDLASLTSANDQALRSFKQTSSSFQERIDLLEQKLSEGRNFKDELFQDLRMTKERLEISAAECEKTTREHDALQKRLSQMESSRDSLSVQHCTASDDLRSLTIQHVELRSAYEEACQNYKAQIDQLEDKLSSAQKAKDQFSHQSAGAKMALATLATELTTLQKAHEKMSNELRGQLDILQALFGEAATARNEAVATSSKHLEDLHAAKTQLYELQRSHEGMVAQMEEDAAEGTRDNVDLKRELKELQASLAGTQEERDVARDEHRGVVAARIALELEMSHIQQAHQIEVNQLATMHMSELAKRQSTVESLKNELLKLKLTQNGALQTLEQQLEDRHHIHQQELAAAAHNHQCQHNQRIEELKATRSAFTKLRESHDRDCQHFPVEIAELKLSHTKKLASTQLETKELRIAHAQLLQTKGDELEEIKQSHSRALDSKMAEVNDAQELNASVQAESDQFQARLKMADAEALQTRQEYEKQLASAQEDLDMATSASSSDAEKFKDDLEHCRRELQGRIDDLEVLIKELGNDHKENLQALRTTHREQIESLKETHEATVQRLKDSCEKGLEEHEVGVNDSSSREMQQQLDNLRVHYDQLLEEAEANLQSIRETQAQALLSLQSHNDELQSSLAETKRVLSQRQDEHEMQLKSWEAAVLEDLDKVHQNHARQIQKMKEMQRSQIIDLQARVAGLSQAWIDSVGHYSSMSNEISSLASKLEKATQMKHQAERARDAAISRVSSLSQPSPRNDRTDRAGQGLKAFNESLLTELALFGQRQGQMQRLLEELQIVSHNSPKPQPQRSGSSSATVQPPQMSSARLLAQQENPKAQYQEKMQEVLQQRSPKDKDAAVLEIRKVTDAKVYHPGPNSAEKRSEQLSSQAEKPALEAHALVEAQEMYDSRTLSDEAGLAGDLTIKPEQFEIAFERLQRPTSANASSVARPSQKVDRRHTSASLRAVPTTPKRSVESPRVLRKGSKARHAERYQGREASHDQERHIGQYPITDRRSLAERQSKAFLSQHLKGYKDDS